MIPVSIFGICLRCFGGGGDGHNPGCCWTGVQSGVEREVGNLVTLVWNLTLGGVVNLLCLRRNADTLEDSGRRLAAEKKNVIDAVRAAEAQGAQEGKKRLPSVSAWMQSVDKLTDQVEEFRTSFHSRRVFNRFLCLSYDAADLLRKIDRLMTERKEFEDVVGPAGPPPRGTRYVPASTKEARFDEVRRQVEDDGAAVVAVCGMVGVGKTTLLDVIYNRECQSEVKVYDAVVLVSLSERSSVEEIQTKIGDELGLGLPRLEEGQVNDGSRADILRRFLSDKKFLLLLDDVRDERILNLPQIGIPDLARNKSKIVFTTSSREIARGGRVVDLKALDEQQSWELFAEELSPDARELVLRDQTIRATAEEIVRLCNGIPSVLVAAARAIPWSYPSLDEWENFFFEFKDSIERESIDRSTGMELYLSSLQLTYKFLPSETLQECFLYCSLFPNGCDIDRRQLVEYWMGEGLLDMVNRRNTVSELRRRGSNKISALVDAHLLFYGLKDKENTVRLAKFASLMARNLTGAGSEGRKKFVVCAGEGIVDVGDVEGWENAERVSLMKNDIERLPNSIPECGYLRTLLINNNGRLVIAADSQEDPDEMQVHFQSKPEAGSSVNLVSTSSATPPTSVYNDYQVSLFRFVTGLWVLDLSSTSIYELPSSINSLVGLKYLNLSHTNIGSLPEELGDLKMLRQLNLRGTKLLRTIPHQAISKLLNLQTLDLYDGRYYLCFDDDHKMSQSWKCFSTLKKLEEVGVNIGMQLPLNLPPAFVGSVGPRTRFLTIANAEVHPKGKSSIEEFRFNGSHFPNLEVLKLLDLPFSTVLMEGPLQKVRHLYISGCSELKNLDWLQHLPQLEEIHVQNCEGIEELRIKEGNNGHCLQKLKKVLPKLRIICSRSHLIHTH